MTLKTDRLIEKMKKLLAMSESKVNENEAMTAARQLHSMLAKHNISMQELSQEEDPLDEVYSEQKCRPWKRIIASSVARLYFCKMYFMRMGNGNSRYFFIGTESNRMFAMHMTNSIISTIERQSRRESKEVYGKEVPAFVSSFWSAASDRISQRCNELVIAAKEGTLQDEEGNTLPVLTSVYDTAEQELALWSKKLNLKAASSKTKATDLKGYNRGKEAGDKVQLSRSIQSQNTQTAIGVL